MKCAFSIISVEEERDDTGLSGVLDVLGEVPSAVETLEMVRANWMLSETTIIQVRIKTAQIPSDCIESDDLSVPHLLLPNTCNTYIVILCCSMPSHLVVE
jgi:hypothetical protein